jgi:hypothetical protein
MCPTTATLGRLNCTRGSVTHFRGFPVVRLKGDHDLMITSPDALAGALLELT